jgi:hypothetical protein
MSGENFAAYRVSQKASPVSRDLRCYDVSQDRAESIGRMLVHDSGYVIANSCTGYTEYRRRSDSHSIEIYAITALEFERPTTVFAE